MDNNIFYQELLKKHGGKRAAARAINIPESTFRYNLKKEEEAKALNKLGLKIIDAESAVMDGLDVKGTSRYYKLDDGGIWIKTDKEKEAMAARFEEIGRSFLSDIKPKPEVKKSKEHTHDDLMTAYVLSDFHLGMYSNYDKDKWDTKHAEYVLYKWVDTSIQNSLPSHTAVFIQLGDFYHANDTKGITPASGHILDIDTSWEDVIEIGMAALEYAIERMLEKHERVHVIVAEANHDIDAAKWMQRWFDRFYQDNPRLTVDCTKGGYYAYKFGDVALYAHHGHGRGINDVSKTLTAMYPEIYGQTKRRYAHIGHFHHAKRRPMGDDGLMDVEIHSTLAAKDQYAVTKGYLSSRSAKNITYHKEHGKIGESIITPSMLL